MGGGISLVLSVFSVVSSLSSQRVCRAAVCTATSLLPSFPRSPEHALIPLC